MNASEIIKNIEAEQLKADPLIPNEAIIFFFNNIVLEFP